MVDLQSTALATWLQRLTLCGDCGSSWIDAERQGGLEAPTRSLFRRVLRDTTIPIYAKSRLFSQPALLERRGQMISLLWICCGLREDRG